MQPMCCPQEKMVYDKTVGKYKGGSLHADKASIESRYDDVVKNVKATLGEIMIVTSIKDDVGETRQNECKAILVDLEETKVDHGLIHPLILQKCQNFAAGKKK